MLLITNQSTGIDFDLTVVHRAALATLKAHDSQACEVSILLTNDADIQSLNRQYRNIDAPTDVLAFAMREGIDGDLNPDLLGDLIISVQTAQHQAKVHHHSLEVELACLTVHGVLHLLGYDHHNCDEAAIMFEKQETILRLI